MSAAVQWEASCNKLRSFLSLCMDTGYLVTVDQPPRNSNWSGCSNSLRRRRRSTGCAQGRSSETGLVGFDSACCAFSWRPAVQAGLFLDDPTRRKIVGTWATDPVFRREECVCGGDGDVSVCRTGRTPQLVILSARRGNPHERNRRLQQRTRDPLGAAIASQRLALGSSW